MMMMTVIIDSEWCSSLLYHKLNELAGSWKKWMKPSYFKENPWFQENPNQKPGNLRQLPGKWIGDKTVSRDPCKMPIISIRIGTLYFVYLRGYLYQLLACLMEHENQNTGFRKKKKQQQKKHTLGLK